MFEIERRKLIAAPAERVRAVLADVEQLQHLLPRAERVEVQGTTSERARLVIFLRAGRFGIQSLEGEARFLPNGVRFVAVRPAQIDARWTVDGRGDASEVIARLAIDPSAMLGSFGRFVPRRMVEDRLGRELEESLQALERVVSTGITG